MRVDVVTEIILTGTKKMSIPVGVVVAGNSNSFLGLLSAFKRIIVVRLRNREVEEEENLAVPWREIRTTRLWRPGWTKCGLMITLLQPTPEPKMQVVLSGTRHKGKE